MEVIIVKNYEELSRLAADYIIEEVQSNPKAVLGLATGSSPIGTYQNLQQAVKEKKVSFKEVRSVNLDEYVSLEEDHPQSYRYFMNEQLFNGIDISLDNTFVPKGVSASFSEEGKAYDNLIRSLGGIDLQLLGLGNNGHIGFNEPDSFFTKGTGLVHLTPSTIEANKRFFNSIEEVPTQAISMGIGTIFRGKKILLIANGKAKAQAVKAMIEGEVTPACPASILQFHSQVRVIIDEEAASLLTKYN